MTTITNPQTRPVSDVTGGLQRLRQATDAVGAQYHDTVEPALDALYQTATPIHGAAPRTRVVEPDAIAPGGASAAAWEAAKQALTSFANGGAAELRSESNYGIGRAIEGVLGILPRMQAIEDGQPDPKYPGETSGGFVFNTRPGVPTSLLTSTVPGLTGARDADGTFRTNVGRDIDEDITKITRLAESLPAS